MRLGILGLLILLSTACTSLLLTEAPTGDGRPATDSRSSAQRNQDQAISNTIRQRFGADGTLARYDIGISTVDNRVTLSGTVGSFAARDRAVQIASATQGVVGVSNRITVNTNL